MKTKSKSTTALRGPWPGTSNSEPWPVPSDMVGDLEDQEPYTAGTVRILTRSQADSCRRICTFQTLSRSWSAPAIAFRSVAVTWSEKTPLPALGMPFHATLGIQ